MKTVAITAPPIDVLFVEDNPADVRLMQEFFRDADGSIRLNVAFDGVEAVAFLERDGPHVAAPRPKLILLDLNLPRLDGRSVLARIKQDESLKTIPTIVLTSSEDEADIFLSYRLQANCYLSKPAQWDVLESILKSVTAFWLQRGPPQRNRKPNEAVEMSKVVLLVEDSSGDIRLTKEAFRDADVSIDVQVARDGMDAMAYLRREGVHFRAPRPDIILLDLNIPKIAGRDVLAIIKNDENLRMIPTVILTMSDADADILECYRRHANCYLKKPVELNEFESLVKSLNDFWLVKAKLPEWRQAA